MNEARSTWQIVKFGLILCTVMAFCLTVSYAMGIAFAERLHDDVVAGKSSPGDAVGLGVLFGAIVGAFVRSAASLRPAWMGAIITVCSIVFLCGYYPGSNVAPRPSLLLPLVSIVVVFAVAFFRRRKATA
jgi:uncharacterized membrane protein YkvI